MQRLASPLLDTAALELPRMPLWAAACMPPAAPDTQARQPSQAARVLVALGLSLEPALVGEGALMGEGFL